MRHHEWYRVTAAVFVNTISEQTKKLWSEITAKGQLISKANFLGLI